jgi:hypothetical protein
VASSLYFLFANQYSWGGGFPFPIVLVPRYKLSLCHTPIKPDLLGFPGIGVFACGLRDHVIMRFASEFNIFCISPIQLYLVLSYVSRTLHPNGLQTHDAISNAVMSQVLLPMHRVLCCK